MGIRAKTVFVAFIFLALAFLAVELFSIYWATVAVSFVFLFVGSMFFFTYLDFEESAVPKMKRFPFVSVLIPCYNSQNTIVQCVESIKAMDYPGQLEIIVINDASTDSSLALVKKISGIRVLNKEKNAGKAAAINSGTKIARGEFVCCIDSDTFPKKDALLKTVPFFSDKKIGAVTCLIRAFEPNTIFKKIQDLEYLVGFGFYQTMLSHLDAAMITPGPMCVYRKSSLESVGGFDEKNITEDMEIALRLQKNFFKIKASHYAVVYTVVPDNLKQWIRQRTRWYRGKIFNTAKYRELLFNPSHDFLGSFSLPFTFLLEMSAVFVLFLIAAVFLQNAVFGAQVFFAGLNSGIFLAPELPPFIVHSSAVFFMVVTLSSFGVAAIVARDLAREKLGLKYVLPTLFIISLYGFLVAFMWLFSLFKEINRSKYSW